MNKKKRNEVPESPKTDEKPTKEERQLDKSVQHELDMIELEMTRWYDDD